MAEFFPQTEQVPACLMNPPEAAPPDVACCACWCRLSLSALDAAITVRQWSMCLEEMCDLFWNRHAHNRTIPKFKFAPRTELRAIANCTGCSKFSYSTVSLSHPICCPET